MKLADLKKLLGIEAKEEDVKIEFKDSAELSEFVAAFEAKEKELADVVAQVATLQADLKEFAAAKEAAELATQEAVAKAHKEKVDARMSQLSAEFGDEKATKFAKFAGTMDDAEFAEVFGIQKELAAKEADSFKESGVTAKVQEAKKPVHFKQFMKKQGN